MTVSPDTKTDAGFILDIRGKLFELYNALHGPDAQAYQVRNPEFRVPVKFDIEVRDLNTYLSNPSAHAANATTPTFAQLVAAARKSNNTTNTTNTP